MLVSRISPAPRSTASRHHSIASRPVGVRPPATYASQPLPGSPASRALASTASTTHWAPKRALSSSISSGRASAAELTLTLSAPGVENRLRVLDRADPAADRERDEDVVGGAPRERGDRVAALVRRGDVEEDELVGALGVVALGELHRVARVADVDEVRALDDAAGVDVQARDDALHVHASRVGRLVASVNRPMASDEPDTPPRVGLVIAALLVVMLLAASTRRSSRRRCRRSSASSAASRTSAGSSPRTCSR